MRARRRRVGQKRPHAARQRGRGGGAVGAARDQIPGLAILHHLRQPANGRRHHRQPKGHRLQHGDGDALRDRGEHVHLELSQRRPDRPDLAAEVHDPVQTQVGGPRLERGALRAARPRSPPAGRAMRRARRCPRLPGAVPGPSPPPAGPPCRSPARHRRVPRRHRAAAAATPGAARAGPSNPGCTTCRRPRGTPRAASLAARSAETQKKPSTVSRRETIEHEVDARLHAARVVEHQIRVDGGEQCRATAHQPRERSHGQVGAHAVRVHRVPAPSGQAAAKTGQDARVPGVGHGEDLDWKAAPAGLVREAPGAEAQEVRVAARVPQRGEERQQVAHGPTRVASADHVQDPQRSATPGGARTGDVLIPGQDRDPSAGAARPRTRLDSCSGGSAVRSRMRISREPLRLARRQGAPARPSQEPEARSHDERLPHTRR